MSKVYCTKCGIRGDSKCPHCRSIFADSMPIGNDLLEQFLKIGTNRKDPDDPTSEVISHTVSFTAYNPDERTAVMGILNMLKRSLNDPEFNVEVAACVHTWELMPGVASSIGCGHVGPQREVPPDPFAKTDTEESNNGSAE